MVVRSENQSESELQFCCAINPGGPFFVRRDGECSERAGAKPQRLVSTTVAHASMRLSGCTRRRRPGLVLVLAAISSWVVWLSACPRYGIAGSRAFASSRSEGVGECKVSFWRGLEVWQV